MIISSQGGIALHVTVYADAEGTESMRIDAARIRSVLREGYGMQCEKTSLTTVILGIPGEVVSCHIPCGQVRICIRVGMPARCVKLSTRNTDAERTRFTHAVM